MANNTSYVTESLPLQTISLGVKVTVFTLGLLTCLSGIFGNALVLSTLLSYRLLRTQHNLYLTSLAVADLLVVGYYLPFWVLDVLLGHSPVVNAAHCQANAFIFTTCFMASVYTLVLIGLDRCLHVRHNRLYVRACSKLRTAAGCLVLWLVSAAVSSLPFFQLGNTTFYYNGVLHYCIYTSDPLSLGFIRNMVNLVLPAILIGVCSLAILHYWKKSRNRVDRWRTGGEQTASGDRPRTKISSADVALVRSLILVFALLVVLYIPMAVGTFLGKVIPVSANVFAFLSLLLFLNHSLNWIVYGLMNRQFKEGYKRQLLRCIKRQLTSDAADGTRSTLAGAGNAHI